jgi:hypothetical protein
VAAKGLADELRDRGYLVIDGVDGKAHYVALNAHDELANYPTGAVVEVKGSADVRAADRNIAALASDGLYRTDHHLAIAQGQAVPGRDPREVVAAHVRRLEALRRAGIVERVAEGLWKVPDDLPERGRQYDAQRLGGVAVELKSHLPIERQARVIGATWLDQQLIGGGSGLGDLGFGGEAKQAMQQRADFLAEQGLAERRGQRVILARNLLGTLRNREVAQAAKDIAAETGLEHRPGGRWAARGRYLPDAASMLASGRYAMLDDGMGVDQLPLVPETYWKPVIVSSGWDSSHRQQRAVPRQHLATPSGHGRCCIHHMCPGAAVGEQHARDIEGTAAADVAKGASLGGATVNAAQNAKHGFRESVGDDHARKVRWEQRVNGYVVIDEFGLDGIARNTQASRFQDDGDTGTLAQSSKVLLCLDCLVQLVGAQRDELHLGIGGIAYQMGCAVTDQTLRRFGVEAILHIALGDDQAGQLAAPSIDVTQCGDGGIAIHREQHARDVRHFAQQGFTDGRILVRLLVLRVLPSVRGDDQRHRQPAGWPAGLTLVAGEDDFLPHQAKHLDREGLVADDQIQSAFIAECCRSHSFLVERGDDGAVQILRHTGFGLVDAVLEQRQRAAHLVAGQFVGVADAHAQIGIGLGEIDKPLIQSVIALPSLPGVSQHGSGSLGAAG